MTRRSTIVRRCVHCDVELPTRSRRDEHCGHWKCRQRAAAARRAADRKRFQPLVERQQRNLERAKQLRGQQSTPDRSHTNSFTVITTPANQHAITTLTRRRKYKFAKRLLGELQKHPVESVPPPLDNEPHAVRTNGNDEDKSPNSLLPLIGAACSNCRGHCCRLGGDTGFIDSHVVRITMPGATSPQQIVEEYSKHLPNESYEGSCVFHTENGCALPRPLRSPTCNNTICGGVSELIARYQLDGTSKFFFAATKDESVLRTRFATSNEQE